MSGVWRLNSYISDHSQVLHHLPHQQEARSISHRECAYVGLDNAGKTTILYRLHLGQSVATNPTVGSNVEQIKHNNLLFEVLDQPHRSHSLHSLLTHSVLATKELCAIST